MAITSPIAFHPLKNQNVLSTCLDSCLEFISQYGVSAHLAIAGTEEALLEVVDLVGVRDVVDSAGLDRVFSVLRQPYTEEPTNWSRRYKANLEKLASGDVIKVAEVVRDLYRRDLDRGLSAGEKRMLAKAKQILVSELALAERTDEEKAAVILDEVLAS